MMPNPAGRKFRSAEEVFRTYVPNLADWCSLEEEPEEEFLGRAAGEKLAQRLLDKFREPVAKKPKKKSLAERT
jgi:hypothetical protein